MMSDFIDLEVKQEDIDPQLDQTKFDYSQWNNGQVKQEYEVNQDSPRPQRRQATEKELCDAVMLIKNLLPHRDLGRAITMIYQTLIQKLPQQQIYPMEMQNQKCQEQEQGNYNEVIRRYQKQEIYKTKFNNDQERLKYQERRLVAKSFVAKGYGLNNTLEEFAKAKVNASHLTKDIYKQIMSSIASQAFRRLEAFLREDCNKNIIPITKEELKNIMKNLLSANQYGDNTVFKKYYRLLFGLSNVQLEENESTSFYLKVMEPLRGATVFGNSNEKIENVCENQEELSQNSQQPYVQLSQQLQLDTSDIRLIQTYQSCRSLKKTAEFMQDIIENVRKRVFELIRKGASKVYAVLSTKREEVGQEMCRKLNSEEISFICRTKEALQARMALLGFWKERYPEKSKAVEIMNTLIKLLEKMGQGQDCQSVISQNINGTCEMNPEPKLRSIHLNQQQ